MSLSKVAMLALRGLDPTKKQELAEAMGISTKTLYRYIGRNDDNLTKASCIQFLRKELELTDAEILETTAE